MALSYSQLQQPQLHALPQCQLTVLTPAFGVYFCRPATATMTVKCSFCCGGVTVTTEEQKSVESIPTQGAKSFCFFGLKTACVGVVPSSVQCKIQWTCSDIFYNGTPESFLKCRPSADIRFSYPVFKTPVRIWTFWHVRKASRFLPVDVFSLNWCSLFQSCETHF